MQTPALNQQPPCKSTRKRRLLAAAVLVMAVATCFYVYGPDSTHCPGRIARDYFFAAGPKPIPSLAESSALTALLATGTCFILCVISAFGLCAHRANCGRTAQPHGFARRRRRLLCLLALGVALLVGATAVGVHCVALDDAPALTDEANMTAASTKPSSTGGEPTGAAERVVDANATCHEVLDAAFRACRGDALDGGSDWFGERQWYGGQYWFGEDDGDAAAAPRCSAPSASVALSPGALPAILDAAMPPFGAHIDGTPCATAMRAAVARMAECGGDLLSSDPSVASATPARSWNSFRGASPPTWSAQLRTLDDENICACGGVVDGPARLREVLTLGCGLDPVLLLVTCACFLCNVALFRIAIYMMLRRDDERRAADGAHGGVRSRCFHYVLSKPLALLATVLFWCTGPLFLLAVATALFFLKKRRTCLNAAPSTVGFGRGEFGPSVAQMQFALASLGHLPTLRPWDVGVFGPKTTEALQTFQETHHIVAKPAGTYDAATKAALKAALLATRPRASHVVVATHEVVGTLVKDNEAAADDVEVVAPHSLL